MRRYLLANGTMMWVLAASGKGRELPQKKHSCMSHIHAACKFLASEGAGMVWGICGECLADLGKSNIDNG